MSNLTIALAAAGGVVLAGVIAHGAWQARRAGPRRAEPRAPNPASLHAHEPGFDTEPGPLEAEAGAANMPIEPTADLTAAPIVLPIARRAAPRIDALVDAIATITLEAPVAGQVLMSHQPPSRRAGSKPLLIEGLNVATGEWEALAFDATYRELQAGVQLANRSGPLNEIEFSEFVQKVQAFGESLGANAGFPEFPDMLDAVARARELDSFAAAHDAQLAVHLQAQSAAWSVGYLIQQASRHGFIAGSLPGRLVLPAPDDAMPPVLTLTFDAQAALADDPGQAALRDITLAFDVPQTPAAVEPFKTWQACAQALATEMDAALVDDQLLPIAPSGFDVIAAELQRLYQALAAHDLAAGSPAARRLFS